MLRHVMSTRVAYDRLPTEQRNPNSLDLDRLSLPQLLRLMSSEDAKALRAVQSQHKSIAAAVSLIAQALRLGRRLFFVGAGTSGRLGIIEAAECPPTFHTPPSLIQAIMAGGKSAVFSSREGAEDDENAGRRAARKQIRKGDVVVGIAASGVTPFVQAALSTAKQCGAKTVLVTCSAQATIPATLRIAMLVGPEVLTGSTRLKAGTATKLVLNMLTLGSMVKLGKTHGNLMVDVKPSSKKLKARAIRILQLFTHTSAAQAAQLLRSAKGKVKVAIVMHQQRMSYGQALQKLSCHSGSLRRTLKQR